MGTDVDGCRTRSDGRALQRRCRALRAGPGRRLLTGLAAVTCAGVLVACGGSGEDGASVGASVEAPVPTQVTSTPAVEPATTEAPATTTTVAPTTTAAPTTMAAPTTTEPPPPPGPAVLAAGGPSTVYVLGDSVTLGAAGTVPAALAGWQVTFDAEENRRMDQGQAIVAGRGGSMGRVVVVHLCTNWGGGDYAGAAARMLTSLAGTERVVWVTCTAWNGGVEEANAVIRGLPATHPHVVVADWDPVSRTPGLTYADGLHLRPEGAEALAALIAGAVGPPPG
jgi:lysophospholipase L1-like esterase